MSDRRHGASRTKEALNRSIAWYLRQLSKLLSVLTEEELERLIPLLSERRFRPREVLFRAGEEPDRVYLILRGQVKVYRIADNGREVILDIVGRGDVVGDPSMVEDGERAATAQALEETICLSISWADFTHLMQHSPRLGLAMVELVAKRLSALQRSFLSLASKPVSARLAEFLLRRARGAEIRVGLTHQEIAHSIGTTRETVTALLSRFVALGVLQPAPGGFRILDEGLMRAIADGEVHVSPRHPPLSSASPAVP